MGRMQVAIGAAGRRHIGICQRRYLFVYLNLAGAPGDRAGPDCEGQGNAVSFP